MSEEIQPFAGAKFDVLLPDGTHRYWSTHCRHGNHDKCQLGYIRGDNGRGETVYVTRKPAQCKTCAAPCICPCHKSSTEEGAAA